MKTVTYGGVDYNIENVSFNKMGDSVKACVVEVDAVVPGSSQIAVVEVKYAPTYTNATMAAAIAETASKYIDWKKLSETAGYPDVVAIMRMSAENYNRSTKATGQIYNLKVRMGRATGVFSVNHDITDAEMLVILSEWQKMLTATPYYRTILSFKDSFRTYCSIT